VTNFEIIKRQIINNGVSRPSWWNQFILECCDMGIISLSEYNTLKEIVMNNLLGDKNNG